MKDKDQKFATLVRAGLFDAKKLPLLRRALAKDGSAKMTQQERTALLSLLDRLMDQVLGNKAVFQKVRHSVMAESIDDEIANLKDAMKVRAMSDNFYHTNGGYKRDMARLVALQKQKQSSSTKKEDVSVDEALQGTQKRSTIVNYIHKADKQVASLKHRKSDTSKRKLNNRQAGVKRALKKYWDKTEPMWTKGVNVESVNENTTIDAKNSPPAVLVLKRKAMRIYPHGQIVALYYSDKLKTFVSIPFGEIGTNRG